MIEHETNVTRSTWAWMAAGGAAGLTALPLLLFWNRLPEPIAVRWSASGTPSGPMPKAAFLLVSWAMLALFAWLASRTVPPATERGGRPGAPEAGALAVMALGGMLVPAIGVLCAGLNLDRPDWRQAEPLTLTAFALTLLPSALALIFGFAARFVRGRTTSNAEVTAPRLRD